MWLWFFEGLELKRDFGMRTKTPISMVDGLCTSIIWIRLSGSRIIIRITWFAI
ncbi:hypothetical protein Patl1_20718 [Pistacia atlantica]|uniref:Uncharacterized protein n=1 Tax=Pistacia atlantica TaxID=434234 RepID=A0ACC1BLI3_9ROSI|nr:hypothetical protein Patl1_20718 [Pistacia atlantica]